MGKSHKKGYLGETKTVQYLWKYGVKAERRANQGSGIPDVYAGGHKIECKFNKPSCITNAVKVLRESIRNDEIVFTWVDYERVPYLTLRGTPEIMKLLKPFLTQ